MNDMGEFRFFFFFLAFQFKQVCLKRWEKDTSQSLICNTIDIAIMTPWQYGLMGDLIFDPSQWTHLA